MYSYNRERQWPPYYTKYYRTSETSIGIYRYVRVMILILVFAPHCALGYYVVRKMKTYYH